MMYGDGGLAAAAGWLGILNDEWVAMVCGNLTKSNPHKMSLQRRGHFKVVPTNFALHIKCIMQRVLVLPFLGGSTAINIPDR